MGLGVIFVILCTIFIFFRLLFNILKITGFQPGGRQQRTIFVSGCDSGFGHDLALKLIRNGIVTFAGCYTERGENDLKNVAEIENLNGYLFTVRLDVTNQESIDKAVQYVGRNLSKSQVLFGLVNNAGLCITAPDDWLNVKIYQQIIDVNCLGVIRLTHAFLPMLKTSKGRIVTITSMFARYVTAWGGPYAVSKYGVSAYMDIIRRELKIFGITVHIVEPGYFRTPLTSGDTLDKQWEQLWKQLPDDMKQEYGHDFLKGGTNAAKDHIKWMCGGNGKGIHKVVDDYYHALTARFPRQRYYPGRDMKVVVGLVCLPTYFLDLIQIVFMKVNNYPLPKICRS